MNFSSKISLLNKEIEDAGNSVFVVEGIHDKKVLAKLGFKNTVDISGKPLYDVVQNISEHFHSVIILSDFDEEGELIYDYLRRNLQAKGIYVNSRLRKKIHLVFGIQRIEELRSFVEFKMMYGSDAGQSVDKIFDRKKFLARKLGATQPR